MEGSNLTLHLVCVKSYFLALRKEEDSVFATVGKASGSTDISRDKKRATWDRCKESGGLETCEQPEFEDACQRGAGVYVWRIGTRLFP